MATAIARHFAGNRIRWSRAILALALVYVLFGALAATTANAGAAQQLGSMQNGNGSVWLYRKHPVALPGNSTFSMLIRFGSRAPAIGGTGSVAVRVVLLGYYKNVIEVA